MRRAEHGGELIKPMVEAFHARFAQILDPDGTTLELWQPKQGVEVPRTEPSAPDGRARRRGAGISTPCKAPPR